MTFARRRWTPLYTLLSIVGLILAWGILPIGIKSCSKDTLIESQAPIWGALRDLDSLQDTTALRLQPKDELIKIINDLRGTQAGLELRLKTLEATEAQRGRLENILKMSPYPGYETKVCRVIRREINGWWGQLWIDRGRSDGLKDGMGVIWRGGVVGRIRQAYDQVSVVELITSPRFRMAAQIQGDDRPFVYQGMGLRFGADPVGTLQALQPEMALAPGQTRDIITTGLSGSFPDGLPIGTLVQTSTTSIGGLLEGKALLPKELLSLKEVSVLVPYR